jgi:ABC-type nitrate/sulfonate/bicarbonate transport system permease component
MRYVAHVLIRAAFPAILVGLKIGWVFALRTLIAGELVFGVSWCFGGLGWYIFEARSELETSRAFAGLLAVALIGLFVESVIFARSNMGACSAGHAEISGRARGVKAVNWHAILGLTQSRW